jgi:DNA repair exonuclease SbcCD ATPase subunit
MSNDVDFKLGGDSKEFVNAVDKADKASGKLTSAMRKQQSMLDALAIANQKYSKGVDKSRNSNRRFAGQLPQMGHQIQDISVQYQMGTSASIIFAQQGSQIASLMGKNGPLYGALLAIGGVLAGTLIPMLGASSKEVDSLAEQIKELNPELDNLTKSQSRLLDLQNKMKRSELSEVMEEQKDRVEDLKQKMDDLRMSTGGHTNMQSKGFNVTDRRNKQLQNLIKLLTIEEAKLEISTIKYEELTGAKNESNKEDKKSKTTLQDIILDLQKESALLANQIRFKQTATEAELAYNIAKSGGGQAAIDNAIAMHRQNVQMQENIDATNTAIDAEDKRIKSINDMLARMDQESASLELQIEGKQQLARANMQVALTAKGLEGQELANAMAKYDAIEAQREELRQIKETAKKEEEATKNKEKFFAALDKQVETYGLSQEAMLINTALTMDLTEEEEKYVIALLNTLQAKKKLNEEDSKKKPDKNEDKGFDPRSNLTRIQENAKSEYDAMMSGFDMEQNALAENTKRKLDILKDYHMTSNMSQEEYASSMMAIEESLAASTQSTLMGQFSQLASMFDQTTALGKAFYAIQQGMAAADAVIKGYQTASSIRLAHANIAAMMPDPTGAAATAMIAKGEMMGNASIAMGFATAGAIAGQTIASFEGGGVTFSGVRSGGMDGKGGRMAMVHPNEKITDLEKGGSTGGAVNVSFTINAVDTKGFDQLLQSRRGQIVGMVQKAVNNVGRRIM